MAEFIGAIGEGLAALGELVFTVLFEAVTAAVALVFYICSSAYRDQKEVQWQGRKFRKFAALGFSSFCLVGLFGLGVWLPFAFRRAAEREQSAQAASTNRVGEWKFNVQVSGRDGTNRGFTLTVKDEAMGEIADAQNLSDLARRIKDNVSVVGVRTNPATNRSMQFRFRRTVTPGRSAETVAPEQN